MPSEDDNINSADAHEAPGGLQPNTVSGTLIVATILCLVCSLLVSGTAVALRGTIEANNGESLTQLASPECLELPDGLGAVGIRALDFQH